MFMISQHPDRVNKSSKALLFDGVGEEESPIKIRLVRNFDAMVFLKHRREVVGGV